MRIAVNAKTFGRPMRAGAARVGINLVRSLARVAPKWQFDLLLPLHPRTGILPPALPANVHVEPTRSRSYGHGLGRSLWEQVLLPHKVRRRHYDALLNPTNSAPVLFWPRCPQVLVVHDAGFLNRTWFRPSYSSYIEWIVRRGARRGVRFVTVSQAAARDLQARLSELSDVLAIWNDCDEPSDAITPFVSKRPYFLFLGTLNRRKNVSGAIKAYELCSLQSSIDLRVVGGQASIFQNAEPKKAMMGVSFMGYVSDDMRWSLLAGARLLVLPSYLEGFGLPALEALKVGTPVVASDLPVFRELFGDALEYVDPESPADIARGMKRVHQDTNYRQELIRRGRHEAAKFSWDDTAEKYARLLSEVAREG